MPCQVNELTIIDFTIYASAARIMSFSFFSIFGVPLSFLLFHTPTVFFSPVLSKNELSERILHSILSIMYDFLFYSNVSLEILI